MSDSRSHPRPLSDNLIIFNKPFGVLCQFSGEGRTLSDYLNEPGYYPAGRLDKDSEGLVILTNDGRLQHRIAHPAKKMPKTYWAQVEGEVREEHILQLSRGIKLRDGMTRPARVRSVASPLPPRIPPIRDRKRIPTSWLEMTLREGRNRQVRRMTAAVGLPTLRLYRVSIGPWDVRDVPSGEHRMMTVHLPGVRH